MHMASNYFPFPIVISFVLSFSHSVEFSSCRNIKQSCNLLSCSCIHVTFFLFSLMLIDVLLIYCS
uniref:Uncharacterized protein n=1 Tax=Rhizophora mucronata TaxID=61149 RepID=A0A2P2L561_RHIMU